MLYGSTIVTARTFDPAGVLALIERERAVTAVPDEEYGQVPVARLVLRGGQAVTPDQLWAWCLQRLAPFQVPDPRRAPPQHIGEGSEELAGGT